jgi:mRNA-degrading endonuclease RelE of RelBE toxin-antitoxin system
VRKRLLAYVGSSFTVAFAACSDGTSPAEEFLDRLDEQDQAKMLRLFKQLGDQGRISSPEKFKKIEGTDGLFEFKSHQVRMPCYFLPGRLLVITHGFLKKGDKLPPAEIRKAERIRREDTAGEGMTQPWRN